MARYTCARCGADCNTLDPPHLCKDVAGRMKRRQRKVDEVVRILTNEGMVPYGGTPVENVHVTLTRVAEDIVNKLSQFGTHPED